MQHLIRLKWHSIVQFVPWESLPRCTYHYVTSLVQRCLHGAMIQLTECNFHGPFTFCLSTPTVNYPPRIESSIPTFQVTVGEQAAYSFTVTDPNDGDTFTVSVQGGLPNNSVLHSGYTFVWTPSEVVDAALTFVATDSMGGTATFTPRLEICACQNGGNCTLDGVQNTLSNTIIMACMCTEGTHAHNHMHAFVFYLFTILFHCWLQHTVVVTVRMMLMVVL